MNIVVVRLLSILAATTLSFSSASGVGVEPSPIVAPLPYHQDIEAVVENLEFQKEGLLKAVFRAKNEQGSERIIILAKDELHIFNGYPKLETGQQFKLRISILTDAKGNQHETVEVIEKKVPDNSNLSKVNPEKANPDLNERLVSGGGKITLTHHRYKTLIFDQLLDEVNDKIYRGAETLEGCSYARFESYPEIDAMVIIERIVRIDFNDFSQVIQFTPFAPLVENKISYQAWKDSHPEIEIWPHEYVEGDYLVWWSEDEDYGIVAEYTQGKITALRAGLSSYVTLVEGCS